MQKKELVNLKTGQLKLSSLWTKKRKNEKNEQSLKDLWDTIEQSTVHTRGGPEGKEREKGTGRIFEEIMAGNHPKLDERFMSTHPRSSVKSKLLKT